MRRGPRGKVSGTSLLCARADGVRSGRASGKKAAKKFKGRRRLRAESDARKGGATGKRLLVGSKPSEYYFTFKRTKFTTGNNTGVVLALMESSNICSRK